jgi:hypothetical protein
MLFIRDFTEWLATGWINWVQSLAETEAVVYVAACRSAAKSNEPIFELLEYWSFFPSVKLPKLEPTRLVLQYFVIFIMVEWEPLGTVHSNAVYHTSLSLYIDVEYWSNNNWRSNIEAFGIWPVPVLIRNPLCSIVRLNHGSPVFDTDDFHWVHYWKCSYGPYKCHFPAWRRARILPPQPCEP